MKNIFYGFLASLSLLLFYAVTMTVLQSFPAAISQFQALWYLMLPLALGFGIQVGLFTKVRASLLNKGCVAAGGASGTLGMLACCSHHLVDVLPILGLSATGLFLVQYQIPLLLISLAINLFGILFLLKQSIYLNNGAY